MTCALYKNFLLFYLKNLSSFAALNLSIINFQIQINQLKKKNSSFHITPKKFKLLNSFWWVKVKTISCHELLIIFFFVSCISSQDMSEEQTFVIQGQSDVVVSWLETILSCLMVQCDDYFSSPDPPSLQQQCVELAPALCCWKRVVCSFWAPLKPDQIDDFERLFTPSPFTGMLQQPLSLRNSLTFLWPGNKTVKTTGALRDHALLKPQGQTGSRPALPWPYRGEPRGKPHPGTQTSRFDWQHRVITPPSTTHLWYASHLARHI